MSRRIVCRSCVAVLVLGVMAIVSLTALGTYWSGNRVVYGKYDIPSSLRPYIEKVDYSQECSLGASARLFLTQKGLEAGRNYSMAKRLASFVRGRKHWNRASDRSHRSIAKEIWYHCWGGDKVVGLEYYFSGLPAWLQILVGR